MIKTLKASVERQWYGRPHWLFLFLPLTALFIWLTSVRAKRQKQFAHKPPVPLVVVGNITVGGTGKTPVIIALVNYLQQCGYRPGVVSRGFGGSAHDIFAVTHETSAAVVGDEPALIFQATGCAVMVGKDRVLCAQRLYEQFQCNIILSDDGLQHYRLARDIEWVIVDGARGFGNGWSLPVGPLRESISRLRSVDAVLINGEQRVPGAAMSVNFKLQPEYWQNVQTGQRVALQDLDISQAVAIAGIGNPARFFNTLNALGFSGRHYAFADHYPFAEIDFLPFTNNVVLMTAKDAVKCAGFAKANWWALAVTAQLPTELLNQLQHQLAALKGESKP